MKSALVVIGFLWLSVSADADDLKLPWSLESATYHEIASEAIGRSFHVWVSVPNDYDPRRRQAYPTLYVLDGGGLFPMITGYRSYLQMGDEFPAAIIVGIGYPGMTFEQGNYRSTDFTAPSDEREYYGGAGEFQTFLGETLMPFIESNYRSDGKRRVIFGQSIGGQFVLYTAQTRPDLFFGHIASNPALHRNLEFFLDTRPEGGARTRLVVATADGDARRFKLPLSKWLEYWQSIDDPPWELEVVTLEGHNHFSVPPEAIRHGMRWLF